MTTTGGRGQRRWWAALGISALVVAGCQSGPPAAEPPPAPSGNQGQADADNDTESGSEDQTGDGGDTTTPDGQTGAAGPVPAGLESFYEQQMSWEACGNNECTTVTVPLNYQEPDGTSIDIAVAKVPASGERIGSLLVNPGGPGASGISYATSGMAVSSDVADRYDVIGFDPRGAGDSSPIDCLDDADMDVYFGSDPTPDDDAEREELTERVEGFAQACQERAAEIGPYLSTVEAARDMDIIRAVLGDEKMTYLGASYGTELGATYAELFPANVGRMVLDGAVDPTMTSLEGSLGQAEGFERAATAYLEDCVASGDCPLGEDLDSARTGLQDFISDLDQNPIPIADDVVGEVTEGWGLYGVIAAMYAQETWSFLTMAIRDAQDGDPSLLMLLASLYVDRNSDGTYNSNMMEAFYGIGCLDPDDGSGDDLSDEELLAMFQEISPTFAPFFVGESPCGHWPWTAQETLDSYTAQGAAPIVVIGTTRDPATPYEWAEALSAEISSAVLISYDGDGHTAYGRSNDCVDGAVDAYLIEGTVPADGLSC